LRGRTWSRSPFLSASLAGKWPGQIAGQCYDIPISPEQARQRAKGFLAGYITLLVTAGEPTLVIDEAPVWRVAARLVLPGVEEVGTLGAIPIDAQTGEVIPLSLEAITQMQDLAQAVAAYYASTPAPTS
jgi:hypothetical protein